MADALGAPLQGYLATDHPVQREIAHCVSHFSGVPEHALVRGIDGCSAPNIALPLRSLAHAFARLTPRADAPWPLDDPALFARVVMLAFGQRRKTLRNALSGVADAAALMGAGIDPQARGETLSIPQFVRLANALSQARAGRTNQPLR